jgi:hypothetical protein
MLRLVPLGEVGPGEGVVGPGEGVVGWVVGLVGAVGGVCGEQLPFDTCRPLLAPANWLTRFGTQLAPSRL